MSSLLRRSLLVGCSLVGLGMVVPVARAGAERMHLKLVRSEPAKDAAVASPTHLRLWFSLKPAMTITTVKLTSASDVAVPLGKPTFDVDVKQPVEVTVDQPLAPGSYVVSWKTASSDMHPVTGDYRFTVK